MANNLLTQIADFDTQLSAPVSIGDTTATLVSATDDDGNALPTGTYGLTIDAGNSSKEYIICTVTSTAITSVLSVNRQGTTTSGFVRSHRRGAKVTITDWAVLKRIQNLLDGTTEWDTGTPIVFNGSMTPVDNNELVTKEYVLSVVNGGTVSFNQIIEAGIAGETISAGNLIYFSETENEWMKCDADTLSTIFNVKLGIAMGSGTNGNGITNGVLTRGLYSTTGLTQGDLCYASNTAGGINSGTSGTIPRVVGIAKDSTNLYFDPDFQNLLYNYAVDSVGTDAYAITMPGALSVPYVGQIVTFKAGTANTGACTLAINGGSAKDIKKDVSTALSTGDILQNQIVMVQYDGTNWQMISGLGGSKSLTNMTGVLPVANGGTNRSSASQIYASGVQQFTPSGGSQNVTIAHGMGITPIHIKISALITNSSSTTQSTNSFGTYNGSSYACIYFTWNSGGSGSWQANNSTSFVVSLDTASSSSTATVTLDSTNITLAFTNSNGGVNGQLLWEAWGI